jgi:AraC family transcriptional regulator
MMTIATRQAGQRNRKVCMVVSTRTGHSFLLLHAPVLDDSKVSSIHSHAGVVVPQLRLGGAELRRIMHPPGQAIAAHAHDWPVLSVFRLGSYVEQDAQGASVLLDGPSLVFHPAGAAHADHIGERGLETLSLSFDPGWLPPEVRRRLPSASHSLKGGAMSVKARRLARLLCSGVVEDAVIRSAVSALLAEGWPASAPAAPDWAPRLAEWLDVGEPLATSILARRLSLHPAWMTRAWRHWRGEGLAESQRRRRVERAVLQLRNGTTALSQIALDCGFCDQAHMNRCFRQVLGRTPTTVRQEGVLLSTLA